MTRMQLSTKDKTLREILNNSKKYVVPKFQRDYSWKKEQWEILWEDIQNIAESDEYHYMGYIVVKESDKMFTIVDGQQRLTTISFLVLAAIQQLRGIETNKDNERAEELFRNFIGTKDEVYLRTENKLTLNRNNDYHYRQATEGKEIPQRGEKKSVRLMSAALEHFKEIFRTYKDGKKIAKTIRQIVDKFLFTTIYLGDDLNAYKIFETLNSRGVHLSSGDLLKNHIFSLIDDKGDMPDEVADELEEQWVKIGTDIGNTNYTDYMLYQWNSSHKLVRKHALFKNIQKEVTNKEKARDYLTTLEEQSILYAAIRDPDNDFWKDHADYTNIKTNLHVLKLFTIRQPISVLLISFVKHKENFAKIVQWITIFSLRYNVICRYHPGEQEHLYNKICLTINDGCNLEMIKSMIYELYPNDEKFKRAFAEKTMPTEQSNKKVRYLLARLSEYRDTDKSLNEESLTVEHILPSKPNADWEHAFGDAWKNYTTRIGNMALVPFTQNKKLAQQSFDTKKAILKEKENSYGINQDIHKYAEWNSKAVDERQHALAKEAVEVWKIT